MEAGTYSIRFLAALLSIDGYLSSQSNASAARLQAMQHEVVEKVRQAMTF